MYPLEYMQIVHEYAAHVLWPVDVLPCIYSGTCLTRSPGGQITENLSKAVMRSFSVTDLTTRLL